jgi:hypothetical protein
MFIKGYNAIQILEWYLTIYMAAEVVGL